MIYTIYDPITFDILYAADFDIQPENSTSVVNDAFMYKPKFNPTNETYYESATPEEIKVLDPRYSPDYYTIRAAAGREFVNEVTANLLNDYYEGRRTFAEIMAIEELLEKVIDKLNDGNFLTAKFKLISIVGLDTTLYTEIMSGINSRIAIYYPSA